MQKNSFGSSSLQAHMFPQFWFLIVSVCGFLVYVAWDQHFVRSVVQLDRSYMATLIGLLALMATCHAAYHVFRRSSSIRNLQEMLDHQTINAEHATDPQISAFIADLEPLTNQGAAINNDSDSIVEIHADTIRAPIDLGWFLVDLAIRLGLLGTIIGFILIFTSLSSISLDGAEGLGALLVAMSGGMGTALLTTLSGLIGASFLSVQYLILGRQAEFQIALLIRLRNRLMASRVG